MNIYINITMKKILLLILLFCFLNLSACSEKTIEETKTSKPVTSKEQIKQGPDYVQNKYKNEEYDFEINFPDNKKYYPRLRRDLEKSFLLSIKFALPTEDINWPRINGNADIFAIDIYKNEAFQEMLTKEIYIVKPDVITATENYVYVWNSQSSFPRDIRMDISDLNKIKKSFQILEGLEIKIPEKDPSYIPQGDL